MPVGGHVAGDLERGIDHEVPYPEGLCGEGRLSAEELRVGEVGKERPKILEEPVVVGPLEGR